MSASGLPQETLGDLYRSMLRIRLAEERILEIYPSDRITSPVHLSIGQEAVAAGVCLGTSPRDLCFATYRSHAAYLAKGGALRGMFAELYGKATGVTRGKGGSMHLICPEHGLLGASAVVASVIPVAVGAAFACKVQGEPHGVCVFLGDGAVDEGVCHEAMNWASVRRLSVWFACENNQYAIHARTRDHRAYPDLLDLPRLYRIPAQRVDGMDAEAVHASAREAWAAVARGEGPRFIEYTCYRYREHVGIGFDQKAGYRSEAELAEWQARDPLPRLASRLPEPFVRAAREAVVAEIDDAVAFAESSPAPGPSALWEDVYA